MTIHAHTEQVLLPTPAGHRVACQIAGHPQSPPVVLTSGMAAGPVFFRYLIPELAKTYRVILWHFRGHGPSDPAPDGRSYRIEHHAEDLQTVVQQLTDRPPFMVAFSMGVQVAVEWARRWNGAQVPAFAFLLGLPCNPQRSHWLFGRRRLARSLSRWLDGSLGAVLPSVQPLVRTALGSPYAYALAQQAGLITPAFSFNDYVAFIRYATDIRPDAYLRCLVGLLDHDAQAAWQRLDRPTLFLHAEKDLLVPARECQSLSPLLPRARAWVLRDASHAGLVEVGPPLARAVRIFLEVHTPGISRPTSDLAQALAALPNAAPTSDVDERGHASYPGLRLPTLAVAR